MTTEMELIRWIYSLKILALLGLARPMLESLMHEVAGVKVRSMHQDISTVTGEEVVVFSLIDSSRFG